MIEIKNVTKKYGNKKAVDNVSFTVNDGDIFAFIGHNGAGKTTLIKSIVGIHEFDNGDILINGKSIKDTSGLFDLTEKDLNKLKEGDVSDFKNSLNRSFSKNNESKLDYQSENNYYSKLIFYFSN